MITIRVAMSAARLVTTILHLIILFGFILGVPSQGAAKEATTGEKKECHGPFKGKKPTPEQLEEVLSKHSEWVNSKRTSGEKANLCGAILNYASLQKASLQEANILGKKIFSYWPINLCNIGLASFIYEVQESAKVITDCYDWGYTPHHRNNPRLKLVAELA